jgi:F0F1-type ATP synthase assembly protein I
MFENELVTRCSICGAGVLIGLVMVAARLPPLLLVIAVAILFLGAVADPEETHAVWYGMLSTLGTFDCAALNEAERRHYAEKRHYFWFGEAGMAAVLAGMFSVPLGIFLAGRTEVTLAFIGSAVVFLPLFVFLPKMIRWAMNADVDPVVAAFGRNEQTKKIFWSLFVTMAGLILARVLDPGTARLVVGIITGAGG